MYLSYLFSEFLYRIFGKLSFSKRFFNEDLINKFLDKSLIPINVYYILKRGCLEAYLYFIFQELKTVFFLNASVVFSVLHIQVQRGGNMHLKIKKEINYNHFDE